MVCQILQKPLVDVTSAALGIVSSYSGKPVVYVSLNLSKDNFCKACEVGGVVSDSLRVIDCVGDIVPSKDNVSVILDFVRDNISGSSAVVIDAFSSLLVYLSSEELFLFANDLKALASQSGVDLCVVSADTGSDVIPSGVKDLFSS